MTILWKYDIPVSMVTVDCVDDLLKKDQKIFFNKAK